MRVYSVRTEQEKVRHGVRNDKTIELALESYGFVSISRVSHGTLWMYDSEKHAKKARDTFLSHGVVCGPHIDIYEQNGGKLEYIGRVD